MRWLDSASAAAARGVRLCVDSQGEPLLQTLVAKPTLVKLNTEELERTCRLPDRSPASLQRGATLLLAQGAGAVPDPDGAQPAYLFEGNRSWTLPPVTVRVVNPIGSGDCVTADLLHALTQGHALVEAARFGIACGSANAETDTPAQFDPARVNALLQNG